jgi:hypothetical protein
MGVKHGGPSEIDRFRALVLQDAALQESLGGIADASVFAERVVEAARARAIELEARDLREELHFRPLGLGRYAPSPAINAFQPQPGWLPIGLSRTQGPPMVDWAYFGQQRLTEPLYEGSLLSALYRPFNLLFRFRTPLADLARWSQHPPHVQPSGLIFHMSRCGSTLAAQMLASSPANIVVSEAGPIDAIVRIDGADVGYDDAAHTALLQAMVNAFGQVRGDGERRYFIKLDCWHAMALPLFRRAFPSTPWVFLYRDPAQVLVSQNRHRGVQMVPEIMPPGLFGLEPPDGAAAEDYWAQVLGALCEAALGAYASGGGLVVNYRELPGALWTTILPHFGVAAADAEREAMARAADYDAKSPWTKFSPDSAAKREAATGPIKLACERRLGGVYHRLEALRADQNRGCRQD